MKSLKFKSSYRAVTVKRKIYCIFRQDQEIVILKNILILMSDAL